MNTNNLCQIRNRAAGILFADQEILIQRKCNDNFWALPGGKIERGESSEVALIREMQEELNWEPKNSKLKVIVENYFVHEEQNYQQYGFYYMVNAEALRSMHNEYLNGIEFQSVDKSLIFCWQPLSNLHNIDLRPKILFNVLKDKDHNNISHLVYGFE